MIPAILLAAGRSSRMGRPKALLPIGDETFLARIIRILREGGAEDVVVVVGHEAEAITTAGAATGVHARFVPNPAYDRGQLSSLQAGLAIVDRPGVNAVLVTLVDVPLVSPDTVRAVLAHYRATHAPVVRPTRGAEHGHPLLLDRSLFDLIRAADPASGAKPIVRAHASGLGDLPIEDPGAFVDVDTPDEYKRLDGFVDRPGPARH